MEMGHIPVVTRFFSPPEMPLLISSPTIMSAQISNPSICYTDNVKERKAWECN